MLKSTLKKRRKLLYKKCLKFRTNIQYRKRLSLYKFKKRKWLDFLEHLERKLRRRKAKYNVYDINKHSLPYFSTYFRRRYKFILQSNQKTCLYYGGFKKKYIRRQIKVKFGIVQKALRLKNKIFKQVSVLCLLERRLDVILYRAHFVPSVKTARQLICHGHVKVNGVVVDKNSMLLNNNDVISLFNSSRPLVKYFLKSARCWPLPPKFLVVNYKTFEIVFMDVLRTHNFSSNFPSFLPNFYVLTRFSKYI